MSDLVITDVHIHLLEGPRPWIIIRLETNAGIEGIGEVPRTHHNINNIESIGERLLGEDPYKTNRNFRAGGRLGAASNDIFTTAMLGGFDMACWDIKGKYLGTPIHDLLGGKIRDTIRAYANGWDFKARDMVTENGEEANTDAVLSEVKTEITEQAKQVVDAGYTALKFSPFQWGNGVTMSRAELDYTLEIIEAVSETIPSSVELLIEGHKQLSIAKAIQAAQKLERYDVGFYEEPVPAEIESLRKVASKSQVPIATGESFTTHQPFADILSRTDVAVLQPDIGRAGGITELQKIAAMASANQTGFAPHNAAGPIMTYAAVHIDSVSSSFIIQETFEEFFHPDWATDLIVNPLIINDGEIEVPDRPGLGVELDLDVLQKHEQSAAHLDRS